MLAELTAATDARLRDLARSIAARLFLDLARHQQPDSRGIGRIVTSPYRPDVGDIDVEASLDGLVAARAERRAIEPEELRVRSWRSPSVAWCLLVDRSGSMHGAPLATSALAAAAIATRATGEYSVISFAKTMIAPKAMWETRSDADVIDRVLSLRGHGTTDVAGALWAAGEQLRLAAAPRRVAVLLSDCRSTEPGDVVAAGRALDELVILAPLGDSDDAERLAGEVGARWTAVAGPSTIAAALADVLDR